MKSEEEDRAKEIIKMILAIKEFWEEWIEAREKIAYSLGIPDEAFMIRDLLEEAFNLPLWTMMIKPASNGWDLVADLNYASFQRKGLDEEQWFNISKLIRAEFRKVDGKNVFKIYSPPFPLGLCLENIVKPEILRRMMEKLKAQRLDIVTYLFNRANLDELTEFSQQLKSVSTSLFDLAEFYGLKVSPVQVECVWPDVSSEPFDMWPVTVQDPHYNSYYERENWEFIEASLTTSINYSDDIVGFVSKVVETTEKLNEIKNKFEQLLKNIR